MTTPVGTLLANRYRLDAQIGTGGMSTVFRAFDTVLERQVAVKLMHRDIAGDSDQLERFRREARAVARLNHPHIVQVIDAGEEGDSGRPGGGWAPFIVFEYVEGETLKDRIRRLGRLPVDEAVAYAIEIARALGVAHDRGIVHRDVKPQNVLIDEEGTAKVTDFGIARTLEEEGLTADGRVLGTTDYVSPEQAVGDPVTGQSDLYSLGVVLFEMLTGDVPFKGPNQVAVAMKHVREDLPDVAVRRPEISAALGAVVDRATTKDLDRRYADDATLISDLEDVLAIEAARSGQATGEATTVLRTLPGRTRRRLPLRLRTSVAVLGAITLGGTLVAGGLITLAADRTERGTGQEPVAPQPAGLEAISLAADGASDYDPIGGDGESPGDAPLVVDDDPNTFWDTETYQDFDNQKDGVGIYVDADPGVEAMRMEIATNNPGWSGRVLAAREGPPEEIDDAGWVELARIDGAQATQQVDLATEGQPFRYYLVWIESFPEGANSVELAEIVLLERAGQDAGARPAPNRSTASQTRRSQRAG
ncbi:MAG: protein kinase [Actinomycetota bacterium]|nr:protein kinase [Actinomycetota bacterium]